MALPVSLLALLATQAGGGGSFGGGGGGGGGFGGGFGGGGDGGGEGLVYLVYWLVRFTVRYPLIGVPLIVGLLFVFAAGSRLGWWKHQARTIRRARPVRPARAPVSTAALKEADPAFDEARFLARVREAFEKAQSSWCAQDLEPLRAFVSDGVYERFSLQVEEQREDGWRQGMTGTRLERLTVAHVDAGRLFDTVTVRVPFRADIHRLDLQTGKKLSGSTIPRDRFVECWTFVRRRGAKTPAGGGLIEGQCPNCGATLAMNRSAQCGSCEALVRSGQFDWVLVEITQESEWRPEDERAIPGFAGQVERDPGFSAALLEDRASVAFWRLAAAERAGRADPLRRVADEALCARRAEELAPEGPRSYVGDRAVGSVRTLGLLADAERQRAVVEVVWDGRFARVDAGGGRDLESRRILRRTLLVFARAADAVTPAEEAFATATCRTCGAHDAGGTDPDCPYCGAPRTGHRGAWLLAATHDARAPEAAALRAEIAASDRPPPLAMPRAPRSSAAPAAAPPPPAPPASGGLLAWAAALVRADGAVDGRERRALESLAVRGGASPARVSALLQLDDSDEPPEPRDAGEARAWFGELVTVALADGALSRDESRFLEHAGGRLGLDGREVGRAVKRARSTLYAESRRALRAARSGNGSTPADGP